MLTISVFVCIMLDLLDVLQQRRAESCAGLQTNCVRPKIWQCTGFWVFGNVLEEFWVLSMKNFTRQLGSQDDIFRIKSVNMT